MRFLYSVSWSSRHHGKRCNWRRAHTADAHLLTPVVAAVARHATWRLVRQAYTIASRVVKAICMLSTPLNQPAWEHCVHAQRLAAYQGHHHIILSVWKGKHS
jgi:hypothetical protein